MTTAVVHLLSECQAHRIMRMHEGSPDQPRDEGGRWVALGGNRHVFIKDEAQAKAAADAHPVQKKAMADAVDTLHTPASKADPASGGVGHYGRAMAALHYLRTLGVSGMARGAKPDAPPPTAHGQGLIWTKPGGGGLAGGRFRQREALRV